MEEIITELGTVSAVNTWKIVDASFSNFKSIKKLLSPVLSHENMDSIKYQISIDICESIRYHEKYKLMLTISLLFHETIVLDTPWIIQYDVLNSTDKHVVPIKNVTKMLPVGSINREISWSEKHSTMNFILKYTLTRATCITKSYLVQEEIKLKKQKPIPLSGICENSEFSDMTIYVKGKPFYINTVILSCYSYFENLILEAKSLGHKNMYIDDIEPDIFKCILHYIYTGDDKSLESTSEQSLFAIKKCGINTLEAKYLQSVRDNLSMESLINVLVLANEINEQTIISDIKHFIKDNITSIKESEIYNDLKQLFPDLLLQILDDFLKL